VATNRTYEDSCGIAHALELIGERWALLVVRELMLGAKRFGDLKADLPGISANVLTHRLAELERAGLVARRKLPKPAAVRVYELTDWARELEPVMQLLGRWAARDPNHRKDLYFSVTSLILSMRTNFDPALAEGANLVIDLRPDDEAFGARVSRRKLTITRDTRTDPDATIAGDPRAFAAVLYAGRPLADAIAAGDLEVTGDRAAAERFLSLYTVPRSVEVDATAIEERHR
jgi:DNA-binding HxlR family transcriptional regulator